MSKSSKAFSICLFLLGMGAAAVSIGAQALPSGPVRLFERRDAAGAGQDIRPGTYLIAGQQLVSTSDPKSGSSVVVNKGYRVRFCENQGVDKEGGGKCEEYGEGTHNLQLDKPVTYIKVWRETAPAAALPVMVYEALNWRGRSQEFFPGMYRSIRGEFGRINDNMAMSAVVAKGFRVRFCVDEGLNFRGAGDCEEHEEGRHNLRFSDSISFIEVIDLADKSPDADTMPVVLYEDVTQGGKKQGFDVGTFIASLDQLSKIGNDQASSVSVKNGYRVLICADEGGPNGPPDKCEELGPGKYNLRQKKAASYLKVWKSNK